MMLIYGLGNENLLTWQRVTVDIRPFPLEFSTWPHLTTFSYKGYAL